MAAPAQAHYAERINNGIYESLLENVTTSGTGFLSNCEYNKDFFRKTTWGADYQTKSGAEFKFNIFGEIQPESLGTKHGALGDFYIGSQSNVRIILLSSFIHCLTWFSQAYIRYKRLQNQKPICLRYPFELPN